MNVLSQECPAVWWLTIIHENNPSPFIQALQNPSTLPDVYLHITKMQVFPLMF